MTVQKAVTVPTDAPVIVKQKVVETDQKQWQAGKDQNDTSSQMAESSGRKCPGFAVEWMLMAGLAGWYCGHGRYTADCQHKNEPQVKKKQKTDRYYKAVWSAGL